MMADHGKTEFNNIDWLYKNIYTLNVVNDSEIFVKFVSNAHLKNWKFAEAFETRNY